MRYLRVSREVNDMSDEKSGRKFILREIRRILHERPHISAKLLCDELGLPYKKYRDIVYNEKWRMNKQLGLRGTPSSPSKVLHAVTLKAVLPAGVVTRVFERARGRVKAFGIWYPTQNRNGELAFVNRVCVAWIWPSGRFRMQFKEYVDYDAAMDVARQVLVAAGLTEDEAKGMEFETEAHREFYLGREVPQFKIRDYEDGLGLQIRADGSHPYSIETTESWPPWAKVIARSVEKSIEALQQSQTTTQVLVKQLSETTEYIAKALKVLMVAMGVEELAPARKEKPDYCL
jgi:hypothetical protein